MNRQDAGHDGNGDQTSHVLLAAGSNSGGQLGTGDVEDVRTLRRCSRSFDRDADAAFPPPGWHVEQLSSGAGHTLALVQRSTTDARQVWISGTGTDGQLGPAYEGEGSATRDDELRRQSRPIETQGVTSFTRLDIYTLLQVAGLEDATCWSPKLVACGWDWSLVAVEDVGEGRQDDILLVLGRKNDFGQLGLGQGPHPSSVGLVDLLNAQQQTGRRRAGDRLRIDELACGLRHTLVLCSLDRAVEVKDEDRVHLLIGWGAARHGQLGALPLAGPSKRTAAPVIWTPRIIASWSEDMSRKSMQQNVRCHISAGKEHSALYVPQTWQGHALFSTQHEGGTSDKKGVVVLGSNRFGQADVQDDARLHNTHAAQLLALDCTWTGTLTAVLDQQGDHTLLHIVGSGSNARGQLGTSDTNQNSRASVRHLAFPVTTTSSSDRQTQLVCGSEHAVLLLPGLEGQRVLGWGWNEHGNLAQDDETDRYEPTQIWPPPLHLSSTSPPVHGLATDVWAGCGTTFIQVKQDKWIA